MTHRLKEKYFRLTEEAEYKPILYTKTHLTYRDSKG